VAPGAGGTGQRRPRQVPVYPMRSCAIRRRSAATSK